MIILISAAAGALVCFLLALFSLMFGNIGGADGDSVFSAIIAFTVLGAALGALIGTILYFLS